MSFSHHLPTRILLPSFLPWKQLIYIVVFITLANKLRLLTMLTCVLDPPIAIQKCQMPNFGWPSNLEQKQSAFTFSGYDFPGISMTCSMWFSFSTFQNSFVNITEVPHIESVWFDELYFNTDTGRVDQLYKDNEHTYHPWCFCVFMILPPFRRTSSPSSYFTRVSVDWMGSLEVGHVLGMHEPWVPSSAPHTLR